MPHRRGADRNNRSRLPLGAFVTGLCLAAQAALAGDPPSVTQPPAPAEAARGVIAYPAAFFAPMGVDTAYDMVLRVPGFVFDDGAAVRGFGGAAGNVLIDGQRPTSKTDDLIGVLRRVPAAQVERIDLIRGGAPGIDMQGKAVMANVVLRRGGGFSGVVAVAGYKPEHVPFDPQIRLEGVWRGEGRTLQGSLVAARFHDDTQGSGPHQILAPDGQVLDASPMRNNLESFQYKATAAYETPLFGGRFRANLTLLDQPLDKLDIDRFRVAGRQVEHDTQDQTDGELGLHYDRDLSSRLALEVLGLQHLSRTGAGSTFDTATDHQDFRLNDSGGETIARGILHWRPSTALTVDAGGEYAFNWLKVRTRFSDNGAPIRLPAANVRVTEKRSEIFGTATWRPSAAVTVEAGVRIEQSTIGSAGDVDLSKTLTYPKPRLVVTWSPDDRDQLRLRIEREVGQLDFNAFVANAALNGSGVAAGNPDLVPQQDWAFEATWERRFWNTGVAALTLRHLILKNVIDRVPVFAPAGAFDEPGNIGGGNENDLVASFSLPLERFGVTGGTFRGLGTWRVSRVTDPTTGERRAISGQHAVDAELHFSQDLPRWKLNWGVDGFTGPLERYYRFDEIDSFRTGAAATVFAEYKPRPDLTLRIEVDEALRRPFETTRQVYAGPRDAAPLQFVDFQQHFFGRIGYIRIRKTFGRSG